MRHQPVPVDAAKAAAPAAEQGKFMRKTAKAMADISMAAPLVMGMRLSRIMLPDAMRTSADRAEDNRMVAEKTAATLEGIAAMQTEMASQMMTAWWGMAFGKIPNAMRAADDIASAGLKSTRSTVKANAKRLSRPAKKK
jgi:hypothetical protein